MKQSKKIIYEEAVSHTQRRLESLERQFEETSNKFIWQIQRGGGINNIHMMDIIISLKFLYTDIAAHRDALNSLKIKI